LKRLEYLISNVKNKYYRQDNKIFFNHLNTDQYATFLYFLSNSLYEKHGDSTAAKKVYALNKSLHGIDVFYAVKLPEIFIFSHCVGTVLGRAQYSNYLVVYQNCTVGSNPNLIYPKIGEGVILYAGASLIGDSNVENNVTFAAQTTLINSKVEKDSIVYNNGKIKKNSSNNIESSFYIK
jgi:serine O-acetyltransferase